MTTDNVYALNPQKELPMKCDKYIGMDVHQATTVTTVLNAEDKVILETIVATEAGAVIRFLQSLNGPLHVTFEESTQAAWLYDVVRGFVAEVIVCDPRRNKLLSEGSKGDKPDARKLAELLRAGLLRSVYHGHQAATRILKELVRGYETLSSDTQRTMVRIKAIYRGSGVATRGREVYHQRQRGQWLERLTEPGKRQRAEWLYQQLDQLRPLRRQAKLAMLAEGRKHRAVALLRTIPQLGPSATLLVAIIDTPHRFRTRHQLWSYSGLAVVTHMSAEYEVKEGRVVRSRKPIATRGLNRNCNRRMKEIFIGAATGGSQTEPYQSYLQHQQDNGIRKEMARLTLARKIAAMALAIWKNGEPFDLQKLNSAT
jgi:transposase